MNKEICKEKLCNKATIRYHSIKPIVFAILFVISATTASMYFFYGKSKALKIILISIAIAMLIFFLWSLGIIVAVLILQSNHLRYVEFVKKDEDRAVVFEGAQGSGKTDTMKRRAVIKAEEQFKLLKQEYQMHYNLLSTYIKENDTRNLESWNECRRVYEFYKRNPNIFPCLISNTPMTIDDREVMKFDYAMLVQQKSIGYRCVVIVDEGKNAGLTNEDSGAVPQEVDEIFRFMRQFFDGYLYTTEQNKTKLILELRNVCVNYTMYKLDKDILRPKLLMRRLQKMRNEFDRRNGYKTYALEVVSEHDYKFDYNFIDVSNYSYQELAQFQLCDAEYAFTSFYEFDIEAATRIKNLEDKINEIGFIKYVAKKRGGTEDNILVDERNYNHYMPAKRRYDSDTRLFRGIYKMKNESFEPNKWNIEENTVDRDYWDTQHDYRKTFRQSKRRR